MSRNRAAEQQPEFIVEAQRFHDEMMSKGRAA